jgi:hypothetical protein
VIEFTSPWMGFELTTLVVIGIDCTGSCKSTYHTITTRTAPVWICNPRNYNQSINHIPTSVRFLEDVLDLLCFKTVSLILRFMKPLKQQFLLLYLEWSIMVITDLVWYKCKTSWCDMYSITVYVCLLTREPVNLFYICIRLYLRAPWSKDRHRL